MKKIDIETIYPQEEKDREDARLREIGDAQRNDAACRNYEEPNLKRCSI